MRPTSHYHGQQTTIHHTTERPIRLGHARTRDAGQAFLLSSCRRFHRASARPEDPMRTIIIAVVIIAAIAAGLWYTPQGRDLLHKFGVAAADCTTSSA